MARRRFRTVLTSVAIVLGVAMVSGAFTPTDTMKKSADLLSAPASFKVDTGAPAGLDSRRSASPLGHGPGQVVLDLGTAKKQHLKAGSPVWISTSGPALTFRVVGTASLGASWLVAFVIVPARRAARLDVLPALATE